MLTDVTLQRAIFELPFDSFSGCCGSRTASDRYSLLKRMTSSSTQYNLLNALQPFYILAVISMRKKENPDSSTLEGMQTAMLSFGIEISLTFVLHLN